MLTEEPPTLKEKLRNRVEKSTKEFNTALSLVSPLSLTPDFKMFEAARLRTTKLEALFRALHLLNQNVHFQLGWNSAKKVRPMIRSKTLFALVSLKMHFSQK